MLSRDALRQLMAEAAGAGSLQTVYQTALRGVQEALNVDRASLLVFDAAGKMRFVAWSGLSGRYRKAVDGHSPWSHALRWSVSSGSEPRPRRRCERPMSVA